MRTSRPGFGWKRRSLQVGESSEGGILLTILCRLQGIQEGSPASRDFKGGFKAADMAATLRAILGSQAGPKNLPMTKSAAELYSKVHPCPTPQSHHVAFTPLRGQNFTSHKESYNYWISSGQPVCIVSGGDPYVSIRQCPRSIHPALQETQE